MKHLFAPNKEVTMTLKEITDLLGVRHDKAFVKAMKMAESYEFGTMSTLDIVYNDKGQRIETLVLTKRQSIAVASRLDTPYLMRLIDHFDALEQVPSQIAPTNYIEALEALVISEKEKQIAIDTKSEIGHRREATAMNTASQAVKKANKLETQLDESKEYCTIKRMEMLCHGQKFNWRMLKATSIEMGIPAVDIFDANYGTVKAYHNDVWLETYGIEVE